MKLNEQGLKDSLKALSEVRHALTTLEKHAEVNAAEAESVLNACRKVRGFVDISTTQYREELRRLQDG